MTAQEYTAQVLAQLPGLLEKEKKAVEQELLAHLEDRMEPLLALHVSEAEAERRSVAAMGDPVEVGKELKKQYPLRWLIIRDIASVFIAGLIVMVLIYGGLYPTILTQSAGGRIMPSRMDNMESIPWMETVDIRIEVGNDVARVYEMGVHEGTLELYLCAYDRIPGGIVSKELGKGLSVENQKGEKAMAVRATIGRGVRYDTITVPVNEGDTHVTLCYDQYGTHIHREIPLPEVTS